MELVLYRADAQAHVLEGGAFVIKVCVTNRNFNSAISKSWLATVLCFEAQKESHFFGLYSQRAEDFPSRARFGKQTEKLKSSKSVKFNFLSTLAKCFAAEFEAMK